MTFVYTALVLFVWIVVMQANLGWLGQESVRLQIRTGISTEEAWRRTLRRTVLFACMLTGVAAFIVWRIWR